MQKQESRLLKKVSLTFNPSASKRRLVTNYKLRRCLLSLILIVSTFNLFAQSGEVNLLNNINPSNPSSRVWQLTTSSAFPIAAGVPAGILMAGYINHDKHLELKGWKIVGALAVNTVITQGLKYAINRQRPYKHYPLLIHPYVATESGQSFPSGHTSEAFAMAASLSIECKKWYVVVPAYTYAAAVGYSRLYLGEHYPTDVIAGAAIGIGSAYLSNWLQHKFFKQK